MVERWWAARESGDDAVLYAYARDAVRVLNGLARRHVEVAGRLSGPELVVEEFAPADLRPVPTGGRRAVLSAEQDAPRRRARPVGKGRAQRHRGVVQAIDPLSRESHLRRAMDAAFGCPPST